MPSTQEKLALRRERDAVLRKEKREIIKQHPILLERIATLERQVLLLKVENEKLKNTNTEKKPERILLDEEILNIPEPKVQPVVKVEKKVKIDKKEKKVYHHFEWINREQAKKIFNIPQSENLDEDGFEKRAHMICCLLMNFSYETKDFTQDVSSMLTDKKITREGLIKLFEVYQSYPNTASSPWHYLMKMIDKHDFPYAEKNHPLLCDKFGDDFTI